MRFNLNHRSLFAFVAVIISVFGLFSETATGQQQVYWRGDTGSTVWLNTSDKPWYYATWNSTEPEPSYWPSGTRNWINFDNNNQTTTTINGMTFNMISLKIHGTSQGRTFNTSDGGKLNISQGFTNTVNYAHTFNAAIDLGGSTVEFQNTQAKNIKFDGGLGLGGNKAVFGVSGSSSSASWEITSAITGSGGQIELDSGYLILSNTGNNYTGATTIDGGTLEVKSNNAMGTSAGGTTVASGATIDFQNVTYSTTEALTVNAGTIKATTGTSSFAGAVTLGGNSEVNITGTQLTLSGAVGESGGARNLTKTGSGTLVLSSNASTYTGNVIISAGMLTITDDRGLGSVPGSASVDKVQIGAGSLGVDGNITINANRGFTLTSSASVIDVYGSRSATYNGIIAGSGTHALTKNGSGSLTLGGNNSYTGATTVGVGVIRATHANAFGTTGGGVSVSTGAAVELSGGVTIGAEALTLNGAGISDGGALRSVSGNNTWQGAISNNNGARINADADKLTVSGNITSGSQNLYIGGTGNIDITGTVSGTATTGNGALYKDGAGTMTLTQNNTGLTGLVRVLGGAASISSAGNIGTGKVEIGGTGSLATTADLTRTAELTVTDASTGATINVASGTTFTQTGAFTGAANSATKIGKTGAGDLIFNATSGSTFGGQIQIGQGRVIVGKDGAMGNNTSTANRGVDLGLNVGDVSQANDVSLLASNGVTVAQSIYVAPNTSNAKRTIGISGSGTAGFSSEVRLNEGTTLTVNAGSGTSDQVNITGAITQNAGTASGIIKEGAGTLALSGANTYAGATTVSAGTLRLARTGGDSITGSTIAVNSGGTLLLGAANQIANGTAITLNGGVLETAGYADAVGKLTVSGASTIKGLNNTSGSAFTFSDIDLGNYSTSSGSALTFVNSAGGNYSLGTVFQISTVSANSWTGYSETSLNNFSQKIQFGNGNVGQISFGSGISGTTLTVAAIPDARVYSAAAFLLVLIGLTECRRRRKTVSSKG